MTLSVKLSVIILIVSLLTFCNGSGNKGPKNSTSSEVTVESIWEIKDKAPTEDNGTWAAIIDNAVISGPSFEKAVEVFMRMRYSGDNTVDHLVKSRDNRKAVLEQLINIYLCYNLASGKKNIGKFSTEEFNAIVSKNALIQYYTYKEIKVPVPTERDLIAFFGKYKQLLEVNGITDPKSPAITQAYKQLKTSEKQTKLIDQLTEQYVIETNEELKNNLIANKLSEEQKYSKSSDHWIYKIDKEPVLLSELLDIIDIQLMSNDIGENTEALRQKINESMDNILEQGLAFALIYKQATAKHYDQSDEGKFFINLAHTMTISNYFLLNQLKSMAKEITNEEITAFKASEEGKQLADYAKKQGQNLNDEDMDEKIKNYLKIKSLGEIQKKYLEDLKASHTVKISDTYFKSAAEKEREKMQDKINN